MSRPTTRPSEVVLADDQGQAALATLRTETALSRFPMHRIAKRSGEIEIEVRDQGTAVYWNVSYNSKYGQAGPLAYKIDTLLVNQRIEQAGKPTPKIIRLGTLGEIARELETSSRNWEAIKLALLQNATTTITTKLSYRTQDKTQKWLEAVFNRYSVIFTGEKLPSGLVADAVYVVLNDIYLEVLNTAQWRPLDYGYMKSLTPAAQRFYEIVSYQVYAALHLGNPRARIAYSEYCLLSTATRYLDFDRVKKQMYKILRPHIQSGYLARIEYEAMVNERGEPDWVMFLTPGPNASREYHAFTGLVPAPEPAVSPAPKPRAPKSAPSGASGGKGRNTDALSRPLDGPTSAAQGSGHTKRPLGVFEAPEASSGAAAVSASGEDTVALTQLLVAADLNRADAARFAHERPEVCRRQLGYLPFVPEFKSSRGAYLRRAIEGDFGAPAGYARQQARQEAKTASTARKKQPRDEPWRQEARKGPETALQAPFRDYLRECMDRASSAHPAAATAFLDLEAAQRSTYTSGPLAGRLLTLKALEVFDLEETRLERARLFWLKHGVPVLSFQEWEQAQTALPSPEPTEAPEHNNLHALKRRHAKR